VRSASLTTASLLQHRVMYNDVVHRTQIYLDDQEVSALEAAAVRTGASRSELIRRAIRAYYGERSVASRLEALRSTAGTWTERDHTGSQFVESLRGDVNDRLNRLRST
jgi:Arc/MetJ-type ribon-helix-helix transcriptional regulator